MHPSVTAGLQELQRRLASSGIRLHVVEGDRPAERQAALFAQGRSAPGPVVTYARPWESAHNWGLAADVAPIPATSANWARLRTLAQQVGFHLLGEWDPGHLEHPAFVRLLPEIRKVLSGR